MPARKTAARSRATAAATAPAAPARTIIYIHGIGNKPVESVLRCQWDHALMGYGLGERSRMAYWCQQDRHGPPTDASCAASDSITARALGSSGLRARATDTTMSLAGVVGDVAETEAEARSLNRLLTQLGQHGTTPPATRRSAKGKRAAAVEAQGLEDFNFPNVLTRFVTGLFLKDVRDFFFDDDRRARMKASLKSRLDSGNGPFVVVAHSQGSMVAYSLLQELDPATYDIPLFLTIGSPLGAAEVCDQLRRINKLRSGSLPTPACVRVWHNMYDPRDIVAQNTALRPFYTGPRAPTDHAVENIDRASDPHSATGYLSLPLVRQTVREHVDLSRFQPLAPFTLAADAIRDFESVGSHERRSLLIELTDPVWAKNQIAAGAADLAMTTKKTARKAASAAPSMPASREAMAESVVQLIRQVAGPNVTTRELGIQKLARYVSVNLTRAETERLASSEALNSLGLALPPLYRIWRNAKKVALLDKSIHAVQASPAHQAYGASGQGIQWAVLDSGCTRHPHFSANNTIAARWDCTQPTDTPVADGTMVDGVRADSSDQYGHGTHVAGIIAGQHTFADGPGTRMISGIAPRTRLHIYKVLDDQGQGDDAWIIKALDHIAQVNEEAGGPEIAGVNLSLGGAFEQGVFGCGHTPLCDELRRLWRQGVVVVLAAGNEGFRRLQTTDGEVGANMSYSIGDPANLEEAIAVGAVHKEKPHLYGVSHFSSRGPTADGRNKPDCVAPGEQILSCRHDVKAGATTMRDLYYKLDGTSMAAPHVSGVIACFLSMRREFIGYPDRVKRILLDNCSDLGRDRALQGAGMPNLVKMLVQH